MGNGCIGPRIPKDDLTFLLQKTSFTEAQIKEWYHGFMGINTVTTCGKIAFVVNGQERVSSIGDFIFQKDCPNGLLSRNKFLVIYQSLFPDGRATAFYSHVFRTFDEDGSGEIDFREFLQAINITQSGMPRDRLDLAFRLYDIDNSGTLEVHEMIEVIKAVYLMADPGEDSEDMAERAEDKANTVFSQIDVNADGCVSREEFVTSCLNDEGLYQLLASGDMGL